MLLAGRDITDKAQAERVKLGIARTFQINRLFRGLSVLENVCISVAERVGAAPSMFYPAGRRTDVIDESMDLLETLKLADLRAIACPNCPMAASAWSSLRSRSGSSPKCCCSTSPPPAYRAPKATSFSTPSNGCPTHIAVLIIEHDMDVVFRFAKRVTVMVGGAVFAEGTPREIEANPQVRAVYLGQAGQRARMASALELRHVSAGYGETVVIEDIDLKLGARRMHQRDRPQWRRQNHAARDRHGPHHAAFRRRHARRADISDVPSYRRALAGIGFVPQEREIFPSLTVRENLEVARGQDIGRLRAFSSCSRGSRNGSTIWAISFPAASSRCCRSRARC